MVLETHFYDILLVPVTATGDEISRSYKKLALKYHPDKTNHNPDLTEKFKDVTRAYEVLRDPLQRLVYDTYGKEGLEGNVSPEKQERPGPRPFSGSSFGFQQAMFSQFFTDMSSMFNTGMPCEQMRHLFHFGMGAQNTEGPTKHVQPAPPSGAKKSRGADIHHTFKVALEEMYYGKVAKFQLPKTTRCSYCSGMGCFNPKTCSTCKGSGAVIVTIMNNFSKFQERGSCTVCSGKGIVHAPADLCRRCDDGYLVVKKILKVGILPGSKDGDQVILKGQSDEGKNIIPGDVIIHLEESPHPFLVRKGNDLYMERSIDLRTALLGGRIVVLDFPGPGEDLIVNINTHQKNPAEGEIVGTIQPGTAKLVKGLGPPINKHIKNNKIYQSAEEMPRIDDISTYQRGDLFIRFNVIMPTISELSRDGLEMLLQCLPELPREEAFSTVASHHILENMPGDEIVEDFSINENSLDNYDYDQLDLEQGSEEHEDKDFYEQEWSKEGVPKKKPKLDP